MNRRIAIIARPPNPAWRGPLRAWLEQRSRELRDEPLIRRVQIMDHMSERPRGHAPATALTLVIDFADPLGADAIVRDVLADLAVLGASPELTEPDRAA